jgi:hypothetical protein
VFFLCLEFFLFALRKEASLPRVFSLLGVFYFTRQSLLCREFSISLSAQNRTLGKARDSGSVSAPVAIQPRRRRSIRRLPPLASTSASSAAPVAGSLLLDSTQAPSTTLLRCSHGPTLPWRAAVPVSTTRHDTARKR